MNRTSAKLTAYADGDFHVIIAEFPDRFEAWLTHEECGVSELMSGASKPQSPNAYETFLEIVETNLSYYKSEFLTAHPEINLPSD